MLDDSDDMHICELCGGECPNDAHWYNECICDQCALDEGEEALARMAEVYGELPRGSRLALYMHIERWSMEMVNA